MQKNDKAKEALTPSISAPIISEHPEFLLSAIVESSNDAIISKDLNGIVTSWNSAAYRMFGFTAQEMIGSSILRLIPKSSHGEEAEILSKVRAGDKVEHYKTTRLKKNGETIKVSLTVSPIRDDTGCVIGASKIAHDISVQCLADEALFRLAAIVESSDDAIISKTLNGIITTWNSGAQRMFGYTEEEMIGQSILRLIPEDLHSEESDILRKLKAGDRIEHFETKRITKCGDAVHVSVSISPIRDNSGCVIGYSKTAHDISQRRLGDEALLRLASIVESSDDAILSKTLDGIITSWNQAAVRMFGYTTEEMVGQPILRLIPPELYSEEDEILQKLRAGERIDHYETKRVRKGGDIFEVSLSISPIKDSMGHVIGTSKIIHDLSVRRQMELLLIQSEKWATTGRMAATIADEINNPLELVGDLISFARENSPGNGEVCEYLQIAAEEIERVSHIARQTLGFYRDTGEPIEVLPHELLEDVLSLYQMKLRGRDISVDCRFGECRPIAVKRGELIQVFSNIVANSIDAMPYGGLLRISVQEERNLAIPEVQITIRDRGLGIEKAQLDKVFEPISSTKDNPGNGIGLWVAKQLVENHGGRIAVTSSTSDGNSGTAVSISLPYRNSPRDPCPNPIAACRDKEDLLVTN